MTKRDILSNGKRWAPSWMPLYVDDYMRDERVMDLTPVGRGVYIELLCSSWSNGGSLPNRPEHIWKYTLLNSKAEWDAVATEVLAMFKVVGDRLVNKRLAEEFQNQLDSVNSRIEGGKKSAKKRVRDASGQWVNTNSDANSATSLAGDSVPKSVPEKEKRGEEKRGEEIKTVTTHATKSLVADAPTSALPSESATRVAEKLAAILGRYNLKAGTKTAWAEQVAGIVAEHGEQTVVAVMQFHLAESSDGFWRGRILGPKNLAKCFKSMLAQKQRVAGTSRAAAPLARAASLKTGHDFSAMAKGDL